MNTVHVPLDLDDKQYATNIHVNSHCVVCSRFRKSIEYYLQSYELLWECHNQLDPPQSNYDLSTQANSDLPKENTHQCDISLISICTIFVLRVYITKVLSLIVLAKRTVIFHRHTQLQSWVFILK